MKKVISFSIVILILTLITPGCTRKEGGVAAPSPEKPSASAPKTVEPPVVQGNDNPPPPNPNGVREAVEIIQEGEKFLNRGDVKDAYKKFDEAVKKHPEQSFAYSWRGRALMAEHKYKEALDDFNRSIEIAPRESRYYVYRGLTKMHLDREDDAMEDYKKAHELDPHNVSAIYEIARLYMDREEPEKSLPYFKKILAKEPENVYHINSYARALIALKRLKEAEEVLKKSIEISPKTLNTYCELGNVYFTLGEYKKAIKQFDRAIDLEKESHDDIYADHPSNISDPYDMRARLYNELGDKKNALKDFAVAIRRNPNKPVLYSERAWIYWVLGRQEECNADCRKFIEIFEPEEGLDYTELSTIYAMLGERKKALEAADKGVAMDPKNKSVYIDRATTYFILDMLDESEQDFRTALNMPPLYFEKKVCIKYIDRIQKMKKNRQDKS